VVPQTILDSQVFVFNDENAQQAAAWKSFSQIFKRAQFALVSCMYTVFFLKNENAKAMGMTGMAHCRLEKRSSSLPEIESAAAIEVIEELMAKKEKFAGEQ
jgi:hypothetical protein